MIYLISGILIGFLSVVGTSVVFSYDEIQKELETENCIKMYSHD